MGGTDHVRVSSASVPRHTWRRWPAYPLVTVTVLGIAGEAYAHWNPRRYLSLRPLAEPEPTIAVALAAPVLLALAILVTVRPGPRRTVTASALLALLVPIVCIGWFDNLMSEGGWEPSSISPAASSPDGRWDVVQIRYHNSSASDGYYDEYQLRSRAGWLSRESPHPLAGIMYSFPIHDQLQVTRIEFPASNTIELYTTDGAVHRTSFNPASLAIDDMFELCDDDQTRLCP
ncbi:hypothetical protein GCM10010399_34180 [Dactylosporangium fulvum]